MTKSTVFISYSHKDEAWKDRLQSHLGVLQHEDLLYMWDDRRIGAGEDWNEEIQEAMEKATVAILLVSADFLTSKFIRETEVPTFLKMRDEKRMRIFPIVVRPCPYKQVKWLSRMNLRPTDARALSGGNDHQIDTDLVAIAEEIADIIKRVPEESSEKSHTYLAPEKISLARLPSTSSVLFGRENELESLNAAWTNPNTNIISLVAWGGVGKTSLVNKWLRNMADDSFRGAERVFGWSFYSQGASEDKQVSADMFIASALKWFGDPEPDEGSPWEKGERLADFIKKQKTLLILDGLEPLQNPPGEGGGRIKDPGFQSLLRELANHNPGLCVITTRLEVDDIKDFIEDSVQNIPLDSLSPDAGIELLKHLGVKGTSEELKQASHDFGYHALALTLLGSYLTVVYNGDVRKRDRIARLTDDEEYGGHAKRVIESYEEWFKGKPELNLLYIMGVFGRPAEGGAIEALLHKPVINGLTSDFKKFSSKNRQFALSHLKKARLLANEDGESDKLDCHPFIREHFGEKLKENNPEAWKEAHSRLYEYYKKTKEFPDTIEEMALLYQAVAHGCEAGRYQEALDEVYVRRILRGKQNFSWKKLGTFGADLAALSGFFESLWSQPVDKLTEAAQSFILQQAGTYLRALGWLVEAAQIIQVAFNATIAQEDRINFARASNHLSEINLTLGNLALALDYAKQGVEYANILDDVFDRIVTKTTLADALHQAGLQSEAEAAFVEAEEIQKERNPEQPILDSHGGFRYCDLLLSQRRYSEVLARTGQTLGWNEPRGKYSLISIPLDHLSLGRAYLLQTRQEGSNDFSHAETHLNQAVEGMRQAGVQEFIACSLFARAELHRVRRDFPKAQHDLEEAMTIAERGGMGLHKADCHLEYARLYLAMDNKEYARENLDTAKETIEEMGYHRRDVDVVEIEEKLL